MTILPALHLLAIQRQDKGVSLETISRETKIGIRYLEAIEAGRLQDLPGGIYLRSYVQQYAHCVDPGAVGQVREALQAAAQ